MWDRFEATAAQAGLPTDASAKPNYFRFLTLMAFHTFLNEGVDTAVIECGMGGEYDSTNILQAPTVTGITSLGIDHTVMLGDTIEDIAWHKAGIMKAGVPSFTSLQPMTALRVLQDRAVEREAPLQLVDRHPQINDVKLGLAADFQKTNASLAIALASAHFCSLGHDIPFAPLSTEFARGLEKVRWPGRCEIRTERDVMWYIDGGHTLESIDVAGRWFASLVPPVSVSSQTQARVLLFNQQTRDAEALVRALHSIVNEALKGRQPFTHAVFCTNRTWKDDGFGPDHISINVNEHEVRTLAVQKRLAKAWKEIDPKAEVVLKESIEEAAQWARSVSPIVGTENEVEKPMVLVTGSVHLVGGFLEYLETVKNR